MRGFFFILVLVLQIVFFGRLVFLPVTAHSAKLPQEDIRYFKKIAQDTWACLDYFTSSTSGFPFDSNLRPDQTNTTNIGLYLISLVAAQELGFLSRSQARQRAKKILDQLESMPAWHGFYNNHLAASGAAFRYPGPNALTDFNKLAAAFIILRQAYPDLKAADRLFNRIDWSALWNEKTNRIAMGYDVVDGTLYDWGDGWYAGDARTAVFLGVAKGGLPLDAWQRMERIKIRQYGVDFYQTAWRYGGLFMQAMGGLLQNERYRDIGVSTANFAYAQMIFAHQNGYPAWGWSAGNIPGMGYTIEGYLSQSVVTPYASALVVGYYPRKVAVNLRALEALGARQPYAEDGKTHFFGFRDSINLTTGDISEIYYSGTQAMLFIALANYLKPGCTQQYFSRDPVVKKGLTLLQIPVESNPALDQLYNHRDTFVFPKRRLEPPGETLVVDDGQQAETNALGQRRQVLVQNAPEDSLRIFGGEGHVELAFDFVQHPEARGILVEPVIGEHTASLNALAFRSRFEGDTNIPLNFRIVLTDDIASRTVAFVDGQGRDWTDWVMPFETFRGILANPGGLRSIEFYLDRKPEFMTANRLSVPQGRLLLQDVKLVRLSRQEIKDHTLQLRKLVELSLGADGRLDGVSRLGGWQNFADADARFELKSLNDNGLEMDYAFGSKGRWVAWEKTWLADLPADMRLQFDFRARGSDNVLEVKFFSASGAVFGKVWPYQSVEMVDWHTLTLTKADLHRLWGGRSADQLTRVERFGFALSGSAGSHGTVWIRNVRILVSPETRTEPVKPETEAVRPGINKITNK